MCYHCLERIFLEITETFLKELESVKASRDLQDQYAGLVYALNGESCFERKASGLRDPLTFSCAVVAEQMKNQLEQEQEPLAPEQMMTYLRQVVKRMLTVEEVNPYGKAMIGVEVMPDVLQSLKSKLEY
mmetsp:Transcript_49744/g.58041  ORF Transcript_49744/g.58041 Transcript_49744/m.58041 type:complete len:129 (+) Transcript_49744:491-877(+)